MRTPTLTGLGLAMSFCLTLLPTAQAAHTDPAGVSPQGPMPQIQAASAQQHPHRHTESKWVDAKERPPVSAERSRPRVESARRNILSADRQAMAAATCDATLFTTRTGSALVEAVRTSTADCINGLFSLRGTEAQKTFNENQMRSVADGLRTYAGSYAGNNSTGVLQLVLFLRAGYYVQYNDAASVGSYGSTLKTAIRGALDTLYALSLIHI